MMNLAGRYLLLLVCLLSGLDALCQSPSGDNYIRERIFTDVNGISFIESTAYHDGLGYLSEHVQAGITPSGADLVTFTKQDAMGNDSCSWLPAAVQGNSGHYISSELLAQNIGSTYAGVFNFRDGSSEEQEYEYDANGNMTKDLNKRISSITYNLLNLPQRIYFETKTIENIVYSADGRKLRATYTFPPMRYMPPKPPRIKVVKTDYCDNVIYQDGKLSQILVDGGYITFSGTTPVYHYYLKDHLGNNRVVAKQDGTVEQVNHYYPFGGLMAESTGGDIQRYKYNGKELDRMFGLDWYDYGARHYDGARAQFTTFDPLAEKDYGTSPYAYCGNDPTNVIDPDGRSGWKVLLKGATF